MESGIGFWTWLGQRIKSISTTRSIYSLPKVFQNPETNSFSTVF
jgi:hypothetical protein